MNTINLITGTIMISHIWFEVLEIQFIIKKILRIPLHKHVKPFDCYTCTNFWIGAIIITGFMMIHAGDFESTKQMLKFMSQAIQNGKTTKIKR